MPDKSGKHSFLLSMSLAELAFLILFLVLLIAFMRVATMEAETKSLEGQVEMLSNDPVVDEFGRFMAAIASDPSMPDTWEELVAGFEYLEEENEELKERLVEAEKENEDLKGQVKYFNRKTGNGLDHPPCWADNVTGLAQYVYLVTVSEDSVSVERSWPESRQQEALGSPIIPAGLGKDLNSAQFRKRMAPVLEWSKRQDPECRHFVKIRDRAVSKDAYKTRRLMIEDYFYKYELRR